MSKNKKSRKKKYSTNSNQTNNLNKIVSEAVSKSIAYYQQNRIKDALQITVQALNQSPDNINLLKNAGAFAGILGDLGQAEIYARKYTQLCSKDSHGHSNLALILQKGGNIKLAKEGFHTSLLLNERNENALIGCGDIAKIEGDFDSAKSFYQRALAVNPQSSEAYNNLGRLYEAIKDTTSAQEYYKKALALSPNNANYSWNIGLLYLLKLDFEKGWQLAESRLQPERFEKQVIAPKIQSPVWQGEPLESKTILLWAEQGVGDEIMFASVLSELSSSSVNIILICDTRLVSLFNRSFSFLTAISKPQDNNYQELTENVDYHLSIASLPKFYRNDIKDFDKHKPYLKVDDALLAKWKTRLEQLPHTMNIGISWAGGKNAEQQKDRSLTLEQLTPILEKANQQANIINLQYGDHIQAIEQFSAQTGITIHDWDDADPLKDLDNFAAQISALDLVISIDNSTVHFSGALGVQTLVMLPFKQDWRWGEDRDDSYWYPNTMQLFRQPTDGDWDSVIQKVAGHLNDILNHS